MIQTVMEKLHLMIFWVFWGIYLDHLWANKKDRSAWTYYLFIFSIFCNPYNSINGQRICYYFIKKQIIFYCWPFKAQKEFGHLNHVANGRLLVIYIKLIEGIVSLTSTGLVCFIIVDTYYMEWESRFIYLLELSTEQFLVSVI